MNDLFKISNIVFSLERTLISDIAWTKFAVYEHKERDFFIINDKNNLSFRDAYFLYGEEIERIIFNKSGVLTVSDAWKQGRYISFEPKINAEQAIMQMFSVHAVYHKGILFHSSLVATENRKGIMFLGPSGIGKTTQAELWNRFRNAMIINGDITFSQEIEEIFYSCGVPWHGSSPYCENAKVPLSSMILLKQSSKNSIRELVGLEKVVEVSRSVFYPRWMDNGIEQCLSILERLLKNTPVYELSYRPDKESVRLVEKTVFG